jgi:hypothetical protein
LVAVKLTSPPWFTESVEEVIETAVVWLTVRVWEAEFEQPFESM